MNLLTAVENGKEEILFEKNGRYYKLVNKSETPANAIEAIRNWDKLTELDIAEAHRPKLFSAPLRPEKMLLPAVNFRSHSTETASPSLKEPYFFCKFPHTLVPHHGDVIRPRGVTTLDYEGEIGVVIGKKGKYISEEKADEHIFGFTVVNDISLREYQSQGQAPYGKDWVLGKNADSALPMGPWITPIDEFDGFPATIETRINGATRQSGSTDEMIFPISKLISRLSSVMTLVPGDVITTGTPAGVALHTTKEFLMPGDEVEITVSGIGTLKHGIIDDMAES